MLYFLMYGFYNFILLFYRIPFPHDPATFDWIPFETRFQLWLLLDSWKAAIMRRENIAKYGSYIGASLPDEQERKKRFEVRLKESYDDADKLRELGEMSGVLTPPELDSDFCELFCERKMYEARILAGEAVFFANGHCCFDMKLWLDHGFVPGPYPGLQYYVFIKSADDITYIRYFNTCADEFVTNSCPENLVMMNENGDHAFSWEKRNKLFQDYEIIGPATYDERMRCVEIIPVPGLTMNNFVRLANASGKLDTSKSTVWIASEAESKWLETEGWLRVKRP